MIKKNCIIQAKMQKKEIEDQRKIEENSTQFKNSNKKSSKC